MLILTNKTAVYCRSVICFIAGIFIFTYCYAQSPSLEWAKKISGPGGNFFEMPSAITADAEGNIISTGTFLGSLFFDNNQSACSTTGYTEATSSIYILKTDKSGQCIWLKTFASYGDDVPTGIFTDIDGNILISGYFYGEIDLDPGIGTHKLTTTSESDADGFILKLDPNGNFVWAKQFAGAGVNFVTSITTDLQQNIYLQGVYWENIDCDPGTGVHQFVNTTGHATLFIVKLNSNGEFNWAKDFPASPGGLIHTQSKIKTDYTGAVYIAGRYFGADNDFDPDENTSFQLQNIDPQEKQGVFVMKLNTSGNFVWVRGIGYNAINYPLVDIDLNGNIYFTCPQFYGTIDANPGPGVHNFINTNESNLSCTIKLTNDGNFIWARTDSMTTRATDIDIEGNFYQFGEKSGWHYLNKLNSENTKLWTSKFECSACMPTSIFTDVQKNIFAAGYFTGAPNFSTIGNNELNLPTPNNGSDIYMLRLNQEGNIPEELMTFNGEGIEEQNKLRWKKNEAFKHIVYYIERSTDSIHFTSIAKTEAQSTANANGYYEFYDTECKPGQKLFYRLKYLFNVGKSAYSNTITVTAKEKPVAIALKNSIVIAPNPVSGIAIVLTKTPLQSASIKLVHIASGKNMLLQHNINGDKININAAALPNGIYLVEIINKGERLTTRLFKN
ncbi:MAG TPA: T9SS type A sorting domain-containing protein [Ferruginibacter sp.]|nr:T9SS type A sorting domain-containing protein [Ferruginibacter sp.]HMP20489.1 T9SS type A sorting domain-containing protein [Ferruginibacter sp.]